MESESGVSRLVPVWKASSLKPTLDGLLDYMFNSLEHTSSRGEAAQELAGFGFDPAFSRAVVEAWYKARLQLDFGSIEDVRRAKKLVEQVMNKHHVRYASGGDPADLAHEILEQGVRHPALAALTKAWAAVEAACKQAETRHANMHKYGVGSTEDVTLVNSHIVPAIKSYGDTVSLVADQIGARLKRRSMMAAKPDPWKAG